MHRYACRPTAFGVKLIDSAALPRRSLLRRIASPAFQFAAALAVVAVYSALCAALEGLDAVLSALHKGEVPSGLPIKTCSDYMTIHNLNPEKEQ